MWRLMEKRGKTAATKRGPARKPKRATAKKRSRTHAKKPPPVVTWRRAVAASGAIASLIVFAGGFWAWREGLPSRGVELAKAAFLDLSVEAGFKLEDLQVTGRNRVSKDLVLQTLGVSRDMPMLLIDPDSARRSLEALTWVKRASVERRLPNVLAVRMRERTPMALWQLDGQLTVIDQDGEVINGTEPQDFAHLPLVVGKGASTRAGALIAMLQGAPNLQNRVTAAIWVAERRWNLQIDGAINIRLPETEPAAALAKLAKIERDHGLLQKDVVTIDLRVPDRLVVRTAPGALPVLDEENGENT